MSSFENVKTRRVLLDLFFLLPRVRLCMGLFICVIPNVATIIDSWSYIIKINGLADVRTIMHFPIQERTLPILLLLLKSV